MKLLIALIAIIIIITPAPAEEKADFDFSKMEGRWTYNTMISGITHSAPLILKWDGKKLTGQTTFTGYKGQTCHEKFNYWAIERGKVVISVDRKGKKTILRGTLSKDGSFMRGSSKIPFSSGEFLLNRVTKGSPPELSGTYDFNYRLMSTKPLKGRLQFLCDNSGQLKGYLKLPTHEYHFEVKGTYNKNGELEFSGWSRRGKMSCKTTIKKDGTFEKGKWTDKKTGGLFEIVKYK